MHYIRSKDVQGLLGTWEVRATDSDQYGATAPVAEVVRALRQELAAADVPDGEPPEPATDEAADKLLPARAVADRLGCSVRYVYANADRWPFTRRLGEQMIRFDAAGLKRWLAFRNDNR